MSDRREAIIPLTEYDDMKRYLKTCEEQFEDLVEIRVEDKKKWFDKELEFRKTMIKQDKKVELQRLENNYQRELRDKQSDLDVAKQKITKMNYYHTAYIIVILSLSTYMYFS